MERAIIADPTETKNPMMRPAKVIVGETFAGLKLPASGLFMTKASPILPRPTVIPTVTRTIPRIRKKTGAASNLWGVVKETEQNLARTRELGVCKPIGTPWLLARQIPPRQRVLL